MKTQTQQVEVTTSKKADAVATTPETGLSTMISGKDIGISRVKPLKAEATKNGELIAVVKPILPKEWNYEESVNSVKGKLKGWKKLTEKIIIELSIAREILSAQGKRTDIGTDVSKSPTWEQYCKEIEISKKHANRLIDRYTVKKVTTGTKLTLPKKSVNAIALSKKSTTEEKKVEPKVVGKVIGIVICPMCKEKITITCEELDNGEHRHTLG